MPDQYQIIISELNQLAEDIREVAGVGYDQGYNSQNFADAMAKLTVRAKVINDRNEKALSKPKWAKKGTVLKQGAR